MSLLLQVKLLINLNLNYIITRYIKVHQYKILKLLFLSLLIYYLYKNTTHDICHYMLCMMEEIRTPNHKQIV